MQRLSVKKAQELFDDMLDDYYPVFKIGDCEYLPSDVWKEVDPIAYREGLLDYANMEGIEITYKGGK